MRDYDKFFEFDKKMSGKIKARDITIDVEIDFMESVNGVAKAVSYECVFKDQDSAQAVLKQRIETAQLPKGVHDGITLRMQGKGNQSQNGGVDGDLFLKVKIKPHKYL